MGGNHPRKGVDAPARLEQNLEAVSNRGRDRRRRAARIAFTNHVGFANACALYEGGGVRACEIGTVMFGLRPDGTEAPAAMDLVRLAVPGRTYTQSHLDYVIEVVTRVASRAAQLPGMRIVSQPRQLRHFTAWFAPLR